MKSKMTVFSGVFGSVLEWYDFTVYAFFAPVIATLFFPAKDPFISLLMTWSVFAVSFLVRPLGGIFFGYIGDHAGRRVALIISIVMMSCPTFALALLPDYNKIGIAAPIILILLRLLQGTAVSGELTTAATFLVEHAPSHRRGFAGSLAMGSAFVGILISSAVATVITNFLDHERLLAWGWRLSFAFGGIVGLIGLYVRLRVSETHLFQESKKTVKKNTSSLVKHMVILDWKSVSIAAFLTCIMALGNYFVIGFFNMFLTKNMNLPLNQVMLINFVSLTLLALLIPCMGILSDRVGRKCMLKAGIIGMFVFSYPVFYLFIQKNIYFALIAEMLFVLVLSPVAALIPTTLAELFETRARNAGMCMGYNISLALFGGTAPLVAMSLVKVTQNLYSPVWYLMICALISLVALFNLNESYKKPL